MTWNHIHDEPRFVGPEANAGECYQCTIIKLEKKLAVFEAYEETSLEDWQKYQIAQAKERQGKSNLESLANRIEELETLLAQETAKRNFIQRGQQSG